MNKKILYTTVFGNYDDVIEPKLPNGWDWKCFSEENSLSLYTDNNRNAKRFKVLPHRYFQDYEYNVDGQLRTVTMSTDISKDLLEFYKKHFKKFWGIYTQNVLLYKY